MVFFFFSLFLLLLFLVFLFLSFLFFFSSFPDFLGHQAVAQAPNAELTPPANGDVCEPNHPTKKRRPGRCEKNKNKNKK
ncbi:hypothetical protein GGR50DRAFT_639126 [Xylaria sp. CBS 124048]|nr:hypothetical protein GGR50DRAFT_639126 [Xylaria sp. CBS 124048]